MMAGIITLKGADEGSKQGEILSTLSKLMIWQFLYLDKP